jgi:hypothetical protein
MNFRTAWCLAVVLAALALPVSAQLTIVNSDHLEVPAGVPEALLQTAREVAAKEFHIKNMSEIDFPLVLVLGDGAEQPAKEGTEWDAIIDENAGSLRLYMKKWDEKKFAAVVLRLCVQRLTNSPRQMRLIREVLARAKKISPVSANELKADEVRNIGKRNRAAIAVQP